MAKIYKLTTFLLLCVIYKFDHIYGQQRILSFQNCQTDADCFANSFCYEERPERKKCRCKEDFILTPFDASSYECLPAVGFGEGCTVEIQCQVKLGVLGTCDEIENVCKCINGAHLGNDNRCHQTVALGEYCKTNNNCLLSDGSFAYCHTGVCICKSQEHPSIDKKMCIKSSNLNGECSYQENCVQEFSNCYGGLCKCVPGYVESENNTKCLQAASLIGENCTETIQCSEYVEGSFCYNNTCTCKSAHHGYGNGCVPDAKLDEQCTEDKECIITAELEDFIRCTNNVCTCVVGVSNENYSGCIMRGGSQYVLPSIFLLYFSVYVCIYNVE